SQYASPTETHTLSLHDALPIFQRVNDDLSLSFYCAVENGIVLTAMSTASILDDLDTKLSAIEERLGPAWVTLGCDCCLRHTQLRSEEHTSELQSRENLVCRLLL